MKFLALACASLLAIPALPLRARASPPDIAALMHEDRWVDAAAAAALDPDPVALKLVAFYRLLSPGTASLTEISAFIAASPDWPMQSLLQRRRDDALAAEPDDMLVITACDAALPQSTPALLRCATAYGKMGRAADLAKAVREAWRLCPTDPVAEADFLKQWGGTLTPDDHWHRFDHLAWTDPAAAARQIARLDPARRPVALARIGLRDDAPNAPVLLAALAPDQRNDPSLLIEEAAWLRRAGQLDAALALWQGSANAAEAGAPPVLIPRFWAERDRLARALLQAGKPDPAATLVEAHGPLAPAQLGDADFLAGWIALDYLHDAGRAKAHFAALAAMSGAAITQGRAHYWLGRAAAAQKDGARARSEFALAAAWPSTYYGQLAALALDPGQAALNARIAAAPSPGWDRDRAVSFVGRELTRAAATLVAWGEPRRARGFLMRLEEITPDPADKALAARLALGLGLPDQAVAVARMAGRDGVMLIGTGWPAPFDPPAEIVEPALALAIARQESNFDPEALSPVGARGLMQLMPATAQQVAQVLGARMSVPALTSDPPYNLRLGSAYLAQLLAEFGGVIPYAVAAYNAGPHRVREWITDHGDAAQNGDMIDWIELIPFNETRNYVQRVIENLVIYRALHGNAAPHPLAKWAQ